MCYYFLCVSGIYVTLYYHYLMYDNLQSFSITTDVLSSIPRSWRDVLDTTLCCLFVFDIRILITPLVSSNSSYNICQWLATSLWFSPGTPVSSTNKTNHHNIVEILLKVALIQKQKWKCFYYIPIRRNSANKFTSRIERKTHGQCKIK